MKKFRLTFLTLICMTSVLLMNSCSTNEIDVFGGIYGIISDMETGEPIRGASVILSPCNVSSITGFDGSYDYKNLEAKQYKLQVQANGYATNNCSSRNIDRTSAV